MKKVGKRAQCCDLFPNNPTPHTAVRGLFFSYSLFKSLPAPKASRKYTKYKVLTTVSKVTSLIS